MSLTKIVAAFLFVWIAFSILDFFTPDKQWFSKNVSAQYCSNSWTLQSPPDIGYSSVYAQQTLLNAMNTGDDASSINSKVMNGYYPTAWQVPQDIQVIMVRANSTPSINNLDIYDGVLPGGGSGTYYIRNSDALDGRAYAYRISGLPLGVQHAIRTRFDGDATWCGPKTSLQWSYFTRVNPGYTASCTGFGACSNTCGAGTQTQTCTCTRNSDGGQVDDSWCGSPAESQACTVYTGCSPPNQPVLQAPPHNTWIKYSPTFQAASCDPQGFRTSVYFSTVGWGDQVPSCQTSSNGNGYPDTSGTWWNAYAQSSIGKTSGWSGSWLLLKDTVAPSSSISCSPSGWTTGQPTWSWSGSDDRSGISGLYYVYDPWNGWHYTYSTSYQLPPGQTGTYSAYAYSIDNAGNWSPGSGWVNCYPDNTAPSASLSVSPTGWTGTSGQPTWSWSCTGDGHSGCSSTYHVYDPWNGWRYTTATSFSAPPGATTGTYDVYVYSIDNAGNWGGSGWVRGYIDKTAPSNPLTNNTGGVWVNWDPTWTWNSASDAHSGLRSPNRYLIYTRRNWGGWYGDWYTDATSWSGSTDTAEYEVHAYAIDNVGNYGPSGWSYAYVDKTLPTASLSVSPTGWTNVSGQPTWSWSCSDGTSGCSGTYYVYDPWNGWRYTTATSFAAPAGATTGTYDVYVYSIDNAGNWGGSGWVTGYIDKTVPTASLSVVPTSCTNTDVTWSWSATDGNSGLRTPNRYYVEPSWTAAFFTDSTSYAPSGLATGTYTVRVAAIDSVDNWGWSGYVSGFVDKTVSSVPQNSAISCNVNYTGTVTVNWNASSDTGCAGLSATPYWSQISQDSTFATGVPAGWVNGWTSGISQTSSQGYAAGTTWYAHVRSRDNFDQQSVWSTPISCTFQPLSTSNSSISPVSPQRVLTPITFSYTTSTSATSCTLKINSSTVDGPKSPVNYSCSLFWTPASSSVYNYQSYVGDAVGNQLLAQSGSYCIDSLVPPVPTANSPTCTYHNRMGIVNYYTVSYSWNAVSDNGCGGIHSFPYWSQASSQSDFSSVPGWYNGWINETSRTSQSGSGGNYPEGTTMYFHVRSRDVLDNQSNWSSTQSITVGPVACGAFPTNTPTPTPTATPTPTVTPTPTANPGQCNGYCGAWQECSTTGFCNSDYLLCRNVDCPDNPTCNCSGLEPTVTITPIPSLTPTSTPTLTPTPTPSPTPTIPAGGFDAPCTSDSNCVSNYCEPFSLRCRNIDCGNDLDGDCSTANPTNTPTPTPGPTSTPTPTPTNTPTPTATPAPGAWTQVLGGDVSVATFSETVPHTKFFLDNIPGAPNSSGVIWGNLLNFFYDSPVENTASPDRWIVKTTTGQQNGYSYGYFNDLLKGQAVSASGTVIGNGIAFDKNAYLYADSSGLFTFDSALHAGVSSSPVSVVVFLINGSLTIDQPFSPDVLQKTPVFIVNGNITVNGNIGTLSGIYISKGSFTVLDGSASRFILNGMVYANQLSLQKTYVNLAIPAHQFIYQPKYIIDLLPRLGRAQINWQEVTP